MTTKTNLKSLLSTVDSSLHAVRIPAVLAIPNFYAISTPAIPLSMRLYAIPNAVLLPPGIAKNHNAVKWASDNSSNSIDNHPCLDLLVPVIEWLKQPLSQFIALLFEGRAMV